jgi:hypothetical protein
MQQCAGRKLNKMMGRMMISGLVTNMVGHLTPHSLASKPLCRCSNQRPHHAALSCAGDDGDENVGGVDDIAKETDDVRDVQGKQSGKWF